MINLFVKSKESVKMVKNINSNEFIELMNDGSSIVLDVRTAQEVANGVIQNAINIDINSPSFPDKIQSLDKSKKHLVYCHSGQRSFFACNVMNQNGFTDLYNLQGGIINWTGEVVAYSEK